MNVEFIGMPCSGKTKNYNQIKKYMFKNNKLVTSYMDIFYNYTNKVLDLSLTEKICLKLKYKIYKKNLQNHNYYLENSKRKKYNFFLLKKTKALLRKYIDIKIEGIKKRVFLNFTSKEKKALNILIKSVRNSPINEDEKHRLLNRVKQELIGAYIIKKKKINNIIILNDEGLIQRVLSSYKKNLPFPINKKKIINNINILINIFHINFFVYCKTSIKKLFNRSKKRKSGFKYNRFNNRDLLLWKKLFDEFYKKYRKKTIDVNFIKSKKILQLIDSQ